MSSLPLHAGDPARLGGYELVGRLGSGGMGIVYLGRSPDGRPVAIKVIRSEFTDDTEFLGRFRSEVARARQVPPFCTAEVLDADLDHDPPYLVVEYVDGPNLSDVVHDRGPLSPGALHSAAVGIATALTAIHGAGVIHRDLKPANVLFALGGLKVIDFGIARPMEPTSHHTRTDQVVGTVAYMAPERFEGSSGSRIGPAADIFAWGAVITFAGTGQTPFAADSAPSIAMRIMTQQPSLTGLPEPLRGIVASTLAKDPAERPSARELLDLLLAVAPSGAVPPALPGQAGAAPAPGPSRPDAPARAGDPVPSRRSRRRRRGIVAAAALAVLLVAGLVGYGLSGYGPRSGDGDKREAPLGVPTAGGVLGNPSGGVPVSPTAGTPQPSPAGTSGSPASSPTPSPALSGGATIAGILDGTRRTLIHFVEQDRALALPLPDKLAPSDGTGESTVFTLVPVGVDYMIKSMQPNYDMEPCLGVRVNPGTWSSLVGTECRPSRATLFSITPTGQADDRGRPTYIIFNDDEGLVQWSESKSEIYVQFPGDAPPNATFSFVDQGPIEG